MVRLLQILPGHILSTIKCDFLYVDLRSCEDYVALSYTWQQQAPKVSILVNETVFLVSENLYLALLHLRKRECARIWG
jgi:Heterokaryon incompatibility protein (HET)